MLLLSHQTHDSQFLYLLLQREREEGQASWLLALWATTESSLAPFQVFASYRLFPKVLYRSMCTSNTKRVTFPQSGLMYSKQWKKEVCYGEYNFPNKPAKNYVYCKSCQFGIPPLSVCIHQHRQSGKCLFLYDVIYCWLFFFVCVYFSWFVSILLGPHFMQT